MTIRVCALSLLVTLFSVLTSAQQFVGTAYFSNAINWSQTPNLYFTVRGGQPNACGDLVTTRNGQGLYSPGWICTDSSGNATMGPWTWANTPADQTDTNVQIVWPNNTITQATSDHVWDKTCPTVSISTASPGSFTGIATDNQWGAGLDDGWTAVNASYKDLNTGLYWDGTGYYSSVVITTGGFLFGMPFYSASWSVSAPPASVHVSTHTYQYTINMTDGDRQCSPPLITNSASFTY